jgi:uncharacterized protein
VEHFRGVERLIFRSSINQTQFFGGIEEMRNKISFIVVLLLASLVLSACAGAVRAADNSSPSALQTTEPSLRTLSVNGSASVSLKPDIAYIYIGVHSESEDATQAVTVNSERTQELIDALMAAGIAANDIQTTNFSVYPRQDYSPSGEALDTITFVVDNTVYVTLRDIDQIGELLNEAMGAGANSISGITFDVEDKSSSLSEARGQAILDARAQAEELAEAAGLSLGDIRAINSYSATPPQPVYGAGYFAVEQAMGGSVPISPGQMTITMEVNVVYEIQ